MSRRKAKGVVFEGDHAEAQPQQPSADYAFDAEALAALSDQADPMITRKALLGQLGGMMRAAAGRVRTLGNGHKYSDPDYTTVLRAFELSAKWLGIANAPSDPAEHLRVSAEVKALIAGKTSEGKRAAKRSKR